MHLTMPFTAGQRAEFYEQGDFFRLMEATADVKIEFYRNGREMTEAIDVRGGYAEKFTDYFTSFVITSASAQTIKFASRFGSEVDYNQAPTGNVNVTNTVPVTGPLTQAQLAATMTSTTQPVSGPLTDAQLRAAAVPVSGPLTQAQLAATMTSTTQPVSGPLTDAQLRAFAIPVDLVQTKIDQLRRPEQASGAYAENATAIAGNTASTVFAPASNPNGAILLSASLRSGDGNNCLVLLSKASSPANVNDGHVYLSAVGETGGIVQHLQQIQFVPAGHGLYIITNGAMSAASYNVRNARYKLL